MLRFTTMKKIQPPVIFETEELFRPWVYFTIFFISLVLLSYFPSMGYRWLIGLVGLLFPFLVRAQSLLRNRFQFTTKSFTTTPIESVPPWLFFALLFLIFFTRFYKLTTLPFWPIGDEGTFSSLAMDITRKWKWELLQGEGRAEPLFIWLSALFFKCFGPSLLAIRLIPALLSIMLSLTAYWAGPAILHERNHLCLRLVLWSFFLAIYLVPIFYANRIGPLDPIPLPCPFQLLFEIFLGGFSEDVAFAFGRRGKPWFLFHHDLGSDLGFVYLRFCFKKF